MENRKLHEIQIIDWGLLDYSQAFVRQQRMVSERIKGRSPDRLVLVEHPPVVTIGRSGSLKDLCIAKESLCQKGVSLQKKVCAVRPDVFNHNIENVPRLYAKVRPGADYRRSLGVLSYGASQGLMAKSGLMLGLGETVNEIKKTLIDLKYAGCIALTLGQYLAPTKDHVPVARYVPPKEFEMWTETARDMGFISVASGPLVRSSYRAEEMWMQANAYPKTIKSER